MEKEQEFNNTQLFCATILAHKPKIKIVLEGDDFFCKH
jgi:hypothetical protein